MKATKTEILEQLEVAADTAAMVVSDLQDVNRHSGAAISLIVLRLIESAAKLRNEIDALVAAIKEDASNA